LNQSLTLRRTFVIEIPFTTPALNKSAKGALAPGRTRPVGAANRMAVRSSELGARALVMPRRLSK
jgi:hypothetical protein